MLRSWEMKPWQVETSSLGITAGVLTAYTGLDNTEELAEVSYYELMATWNGLMLR